MTADRELLLVENAAVALWKEISKQRHERRITDAEINLCDAVSAMLSARPNAAPQPSTPERGGIYQDKEGRKYVLMNTGPYKNLVVYLKPDGNTPCPSEREDAWTTCSCGYPHSPCKKIRQGAPASAAPYDCGDILATCDMSNPDQPKAAGQVSLGESVSDLAADRTADTTAEPAPAAPSDAVLVLRETFQHIINALYRKDNVDSHRFAAELEAMLAARPGPEEERG